jgi:exonuclease SbcC
MKIKSIRIQNFQSHKDTSLHLHQGVNVITGQTDSGKSAIMRALRWVAFNRPMGNEFRSWWARERGGETKVEIELEDGSIVRRIRTTSKNQYELVEQDGKEFVFESFGTSVPEEIQEVLGIGDLNWQNQHDAPFLLSSATSSGEVARRLNEVSDLKSIDSTISYAASKIREHKAKSLQAQERVTSIQDKLDNMPDQKRMKDLMEVVSDILKKLISLQKAASRLKRTISDYEDSKDRLKKAKSKASEELDPLFSEVDQLLITLKSKKNRQDGLQKLLDGYMAIFQNLKKTAKEAKEIQKEFEEAFPNTCPLCGKKV